MIQHDSSHHQFVTYADSKWYLITSLDDYSRLILFAVLVERETTWTNIIALKVVILRYGIPYSYYIDSHSIYRFVQGRDSNWRNHYKLTDEVEPQWKQVLNDCGDMSKAAEIIRCTGNDFAVLVGRDSFLYGFLAYGSHGSVAATANIVPRLVVSIYELYQKGEYQAALEAQFKLAPLRMAFSLGSFPVIMKEALKLRSVDMGNTLKLIGSLDVEVREKLRKILEEIVK